jgi:hypothetical protein
VRAYARHRGCSAPAVLKAIDRGRLRLIDRHRRRQGQDRGRRARRSRVGREHGPLARVRRDQGTGESAPSSVRAAGRSAASAAAITSTTAPPAAVCPAEQTLREGESLRAPPLDPEERWKLNEASAEEKKYKALLAKIEYQKSSASSSRRRTSRPPPPRSSRSSEQNFSRSHRRRVRSHRTGRSRMSTSSTA